MTHALSLVGTHVEPQSPRCPPFLPAIFTPGGLAPGHTMPLTTAGGFSTAPGLGAGTWQTPEGGRMIQMRDRQLKKGAVLLGERLPVGLKFTESNSEWTSHAFHPAWGHLSVYARKNPLYTAFPLHHAGPEAVLRLSRALDAGWRPSKYIHQPPHPTETLTLNGQLAEIDVDMVSVIQALNDRGFPTGFCCQGKPGGGLYFVLQHGVPLPPDLLQAARNAGFSIGGPSGKMLPLSEPSTWRFGLWDSAPGHLLAPYHQKLRTLLDDWTSGTVDLSGERYRTEPTPPPLPEWWTAGN